MQSPYSDTTETRQAIIEACLAMQAAGVNQGVSGNISLRTDAGMLITPSGQDYEKMHPDMMVLMPLDGSPPGKGQMKPSSEWQFHRDILLAKPAEMAVVHAHPVFCTALAMNHQPIPACHYMVAAFGGDDVPVAEYALFGSQDLSRLVVQALENRYGCLMANHGAVVTGDSLDRALWRMIELETLAKGYVTSLNIGNPKILTPEQMSEVKKAFADYGLRAR
ncbi:class II aldolase/adducin family protein [Pseudophaeobacter sp.]|uniref:class II aldolase/adducin family protein n=1 Tax=Pseudophaeobacter sp. TaxID=1971739 RepID=UPI0032994158